MSCLPDTCILVATNIDGVPPDLSDVPDVISCTLVQGRWNGQVEESYLVALEYQTCDAGHEAHMQAAARLAQRYGQECVLYATRRACVNRFSAALRYARNDDVVQDNGTYLPDGSGFRFVSGAYGGWMVAFVRPDASRFSVRDMEQGLDA